MDVAVEACEPLLSVAVHVVRQGVTGVLGGLEERTEQRVLGRTALQNERPVATAPVVGAGQAGLHPLEVGQAVQVVPGLHAGLGAPALVVEGVAALEDHPVDAARPAEQLAARVVDAPSVHERLGVGLVLPVVETVPDRNGQGRRHLDERIEPEVGPPCLEHQHAGPGVGTEPVRECASGGTAADDHDVVRVPARPAHWSAPRTSAGRWARCCARRAWSRGTPRARRARARGRYRTACSRPTRPAARTGGSR